MTDIRASISIDGRIYRIYGATPERLPDLDHEEWRAMATAIHGSDQYRVVDRCRYPVGPPTAGGGDGGDGG